MAKTYTEEQLNTFDKATLIQLLLMQQSQLQEIDKKLQLLLEQVAVLKNNRFGKKSEKLGIENQISFMEVDGDIVFFNEAEAVNALVPEDEEKPTKPKNAKTKGKRTADIKDLPVILVDHRMTESELVLVYKCRQKKLNSLYYKKKEQRRCSTWRKIKNRILRNSSSRSSISTMPEVPHILNWNMNMA